MFLIQVNAVNYTISVIQSMDATTGFSSKEVLMN